MHFSKMIDMAKSPEETKEDMAKYSMPVESSAPAYPYGLCISLGEDELAKLGLDGDLPDVGDMIHIAAMAKVTSASQNERVLADGSKEVCKRIELQITHLATEDEDREVPMRSSEERQKGRYGKEAEA